MRQSNELYRECINGNYYCTLCEALCPDKHDCRKCAIPIVWNERATQKYRMG